MSNLQALMIAVGLALSGVVLATAQQTSPNAINGCQYIAAGVTLTNLQRSAFLCDINGRLRVTTS